MNDRTAGKAFRIKDGVLHVSEDRWKSPEEQLQRKRVVNLKKVLSSVASLPDKSQVESFISKFKEFANTKGREFTEKELKNLTIVLRYPLEAKNNNFSASMQKILPKIIGFIENWYKNTVLRRFLSEIIENPETYDKQFYTNSLELLKNLFEFLVDHKQLASHLIRLEEGLGEPIVDLGDSLEGMTDVGKEENNTDGFVFDTVEFPPPKDLPQ